jgi:hypothetical protein
VIRALVALACMTARSFGLRPGHGGALVSSILAGLMLSFAYVDFNSDTIAFCIFSFSLGLNCTGVYFGLQRAERHRRWEREAVAYLMTVDGRGH